MARKGIQKVKTGCTTCKIRKVKCDEQHPHCKRCINTGRKCDGYVSPPRGTYTWSQLLQLTSLPTKAIPVVEQRALSLYSELVAPDLAGSLNGYFWTNLVLQVSDQEVAAKHAVLAISSLYETLCMDATGGLHQDRRNPFAVWHYNEAIKNLRTTNDQGVILFVCALFVCIEFLRGDHESAVNHCRHGINMLNDTHAKSVFIRDYIEPIFSRLSLFPYFFGATPDTFPSLDGPSSAVREPFQNAAEAYSAMNPSLVRSIRFVRSADSHRLGVSPYNGPHADFMGQRKDIEHALDSWFESFDLYKANRKSERQDDMVMQLAEMQWLICKIWIATCWELDEAVYDEHMEKFRSIVDLALEAAVIAELPPKRYRRGKFMFESGFSPLLAFVVIKCRSLSIRVAALELMKRLSWPRETLWDRTHMFCAGQRTIEIEHDLELDVDLHGVIDSGILPPEVKRIKDSVIRLESDAQSEDNGDSRRRIYFIMKNPDGEGVVVRDERFKSK